MRITKHIYTAPLSEIEYLTSEEAFLTTSITSGQQIGDTGEEDDWGEL